MINGSPTNLDTPHAAYRYDAWGLPRGSGNYGTGIWTQGTTLVTSTALAGQIASRQLLRYAGYAWDAESGLYYCSARYYDPATRQWTTADAAKADGEESAYQYCGGEPVGATDPSGTEWTAHKSEGKVTYQSWFIKWWTCFSIRFRASWESNGAKKLRNVKYRAYGPYVNPIIDSVYDVEFNPDYDSDMTNTYDKEGRWVRSTMYATAQFKCAVGIGIKAIGLQLPAGSWKPTETMKLWSQGYWNTKHPDGIAVCHDPCYHSWSEAGLWADDPTHRTLGY
jgi:RHS repeat-associated protein